MNAYLIELWNRLGARSPRFFQVLQWIFGALTFANLIPGALDRYFNVQMPDGMVNLCSDIAKCTASFMAATFLPVRNKPIAAGESGVLTVTEESKLPYTVKHENKEKDGPQTTGS
jgi:hypothetical protein